jgi:hypothetical protein
MVNSKLLASKTPGDGHAYGQTGDIDKRMYFVAFQVADGNLEEVF